MFGQNKSAKLHTWVEERLSAYIDDQLSTAERARLEQHIGECAQCRASLESMRWTVALVKQAPVPVTRRSFTLAVPAKRTQPAFGFGFASLATAIATLALIAVIGVDAISRMSATTSAPAVQKLSAPTQAVALAPKAAEATQLPAPTKAPALSAAPPPAPLAVPTSAPPPASSSSAAASPTQSALDSSKAETATQPARAAAGTGAIPTATVPLPTATATPTETATPIPPTETPAPTTIAQAQRNSAPGPTSAVTPASSPILSPVRIAEIGLFFGVIFFGTLAILLRRRR